MTMERNHIFLLVLDFFIVSLTFHSKRHHTPVLVDLLETFTAVCCIPTVIVATWMRRFPLWFWWMKPRQYVHHDVVENDVWHTTPQMSNLKHWQIFRMTFMAFEQLVLELTPFLQPIVPHCVSNRPPMSIRKQVKLVLYRLAHGISCEMMDLLYGCGASTIQKYTKIKCKILSSGEGLFTTYIHAPIGDRL